MRVSREDFSWAVSEGAISEAQAEDLWRVWGGVGRIARGSTFRTLPTTLGPWSSSVP